MGFAFVWTNSSQCLNISIRRVFLRPSVTPLPSSLLPYSYLIPSLLFGVLPFSYLWFLLRSPSLPLSFPGSHSLPSLICLIFPTICKPYFSPLPYLFLPHFHLYSFSRLLPISFLSLLLYPGLLLSPLTFPLFPFHPHLPFPSFSSIDVIRSPSLLYLPLELHASLPFLPRPQYIRLSTLAPLYSVQSL